MTRLFVDADSCPVKAETLRVAQRHGLQTLLVSDGGIRPPISRLARLVVVGPGPDSADNWIAENITKSDITITNDITLAARYLKQGAKVLRPNG